MFSIVNNGLEQAKYSRVTTIYKGSNARIEIYRDSEHLLMYHSTIKANSITENQIELPVPATRWIYDTIVNGFWRTPSEGGLAKNQHAVSKIFEGEEILISRSSNAGDYGKSGFNIRNKSRKSYIASFMPQSIQINDEILKDSILDIISDV